MLTYEPSEENRSSEGGSKRSCEGKTDLMKEVSQNFDFKDIISWMLL